MNSANKSKKKTICKIDKRVVRFPPSPQNKTEVSSLATEEVHGTHPRARREIDY